VSKTPRKSKSEPEAPQAPEAPVTALIEAAVTPEPEQVESGPPVPDPTPVLPAVDALKLLRDSIDIAIAQAALPPVAHYAVLVPDSGSAQCISAATAEELAKLLRPFHGKDCQVFAFSGQRLGISKPPRFLVTPGGRHALFDVGDDESLDETGFMGTAKS
jgi:hypothetical protein